MVAPFANAWHARPLVTDVPRLWLPVSVYRWASRRAVCGPRVGVRAIAGVRALLVAQEPSNTACTPITLRTISSNSRLQ